MHQCSCYCHPNWRSPEFVSLEMNEKSAVQSSTRTLFTMLYYSYKCNNARNNKVQSLIAKTHLVLTSSNEQETM